jgi:restriction endonuclease S subunit
MKSSGVEWLGDVPEHWETWKIGHIFRQIGSGTTPPTSKQEYYEGTIPWVTTSELRDNIIVGTQKNVTEEAIKEFSALKKYPTGTLLIALYGATIGRIGLLGIEATTNQACCSLVSPRNALPRFVFYSLLASRSWIIGLAYGGGQPNISQGIVRNLKLPVPPMIEQEKIVEFLDEELAHLDNLNQQIEETIHLLERQRIALISAAVTGKIDVREQGN